MLNLDRRVGQRIMIGDNIKIMVTCTRQGLVGIGIEAPDDIPVHRREIWERIKLQNALEEEGFI